jgi:1-deoxy-D-xylulose-5-phosphate reductoisomerase
MKRVSIFGATGSVGLSTLDLVRRDPDAYRVVALTANSDVDSLAAQARETGAQVAVVAQERHYRALKDALAGSGIEAAAGEQALVEAAALDADWTMAAIVGCAGLKPTMAALKSGGAVALANKESLVSAGGLMMQAANASGASLLPVDSEHNAIFQVFPHDDPAQVERVILTASGGPFRTRSRDEMRGVSVADACKHPTWSMGAKISIDSATLMNKGLELIEAAQLFPVDVERLDVIVHPQSVIHSMVEYVDGSVLAQLGSPDMRIPIAYAMGWPERIATPAARLDLAAIASLSFEKPDLERFPCLALAWAAMRAGGSAPCILNAANEIAVAAFIAGQAGFLDIDAIVAETLNMVASGPVATLEEVMAIDAAARRTARALVAKRAA